MNSFVFFTSLYGKLKPSNKVPKFILSPMRYVVRSVWNSFFSNSLDRIKPNYQMERNDVIVSLTSFPGRINNVWKVICSLKLQEIKTYKIILWLSKEQFDNKKSLPLKLLKLEDNSFEIRLVQGDLRSHKKYYYAFKEFPNKTIITVDDDILYHPLTLSFLLDGSSRFQDSIIANITSKISYKNNVILPYTQWPSVYTAYFSENLLQIGAGGVLYPPRCLDPLVLEESVFRKYAPFADDIWLNSMARKHRTIITQSGCNILFMPISLDTPSLNAINVSEGKNDIQLENIRNYLIEHFNVDVYDINYMC